MKVTAEKTVDDCVLRKIIAVETEQFLLMSFKIYHVMI